MSQPYLILYLVGTSSKWNSHSIPDGIEYGYFIPTGMEAFDSHWNGMLIPFQQEWKAILGLALRNMRPDMNSVDDNVFKELRKM